MRGTIITALNSLSPRQRILVATAVLLDGREAALYLDKDEEIGSLLKDVAEELGKCDPSLRMMVLGTVIKESVKELE